MPATPAVTITIKIPPELYTWLREQGNMTQTIIDALEKKRRR